MYQTKKEKLAKSLEYEIKMIELKNKTQDVLHQLILELDYLNASHNPIKRGRGRPRKIIGCLNQVEIQIINTEDLIL